MSDFGGAVLDSGYEYILPHYGIFFYPIDIYFQNDRKSPTSKEMSPVVVDGLQKLVRVVILVIKLNLLTIYCHSLIFSIDFRYIPPS
jgi:hypothetical protein